MSRFYSQYLGALYAGILWYVLCSSWAVETLLFPPLEEKDNYILSMAARCAVPTENDPDTNLECAFASSTENTPLFVDDALLGSRQMVLLSLLRSLLFLLLPLLLLYFFAQFAPHLLGLGRCGGGTPVPAAPLLPHLRRHC